MAHGINPISALGAKGLSGAAGRQKVGGASFKEILGRSIAKVNDLQIDAETAINNLAVGKTKNITEVMVAVEKADLAFRNLMAVRNKIIAAYKDIEQLRI